MNLTPTAPRRLNVNVNGRSRSPSPGTHNNESTSTARNNFLNSDNTDLFRTRRNAGEDTTGKEMIPLIQAEKIDPPLANSETDDSGDDREVVQNPYPGIDDGFFSNRLNPDGPTVPGSEAQPGDSGTSLGDPGAVDDPDGRRFPSRGITPNNIPMSPTFGTNNKPMFPDFELGAVPDLESIPDINVYQHKKTLAQGMMDLALFSANANQLRYVLESDSHPYYYPGIVLISISLIFQVAIGVGLIWNSRYNVKDAKEICIANKINNFTIIGIFLVTVVNVFISAFGVASVQPVIAAPAAAASNGPT